MQTGGGLATALATTGMAGTAFAQTSTSTPETDADNALSIPLYPYGQEIRLDPHRAINWGPEWILLPNVWAGLLRFDANGKVMPDLAAAIDPEDEGATWVATIRSGATFASGNPVTAGALIAGWKRALDPQQLAATVAFMQRVQGFDAYISGESDEIGFEARDDGTVAIHLDAPYALFPEDLAAFVWAAVDVAALEGVSEADVPYAQAAAGPWQFVAIEDDRYIRMEQAASAGSAAPTSFDAVQWQIMDGPEAANAALDAYRDGQLQIADITAPLRSAVADDPTLSSQLQTVPLSGSTLLIGMNFNQEPFDNPAVRQAVAAAIDREQWATGIMNGTFSAASSITPPVLTDTANYSAPEAIAFDPDTARQLLTDAGITADTMPTVTYYLPANANEDEVGQAQALLEMIETNAGLVIELDTSLTAAQIEALRHDQGGLQFDVRWWWPFTNSPSGLADIGLPDAPAMEGWFNWSPELANDGIAKAAQTFADTIAEAGTALDAAARNQLFAQAEQIMIDTVVYVPLGNGVQEYVQSPALTGTRQGTFTGYAPGAFDDQVEYSPANSTPAAGTPGA